ncbi:MAG: hypothetical protein ACLR56_07770 [Oscillospiraceae bacterium]
MVLTDRTEKATFAARAAAVNIVPNSTGAAKAIGLTPGANGKPIVLPSVFRFRPALPPSSLLLLRARM